MRKTDLSFLMCPRCSGKLALEAVDGPNAEIIESAQLCCQTCGTRYPVEHGIPRFVPRENYASNFGLEWIQHAQTQYDHHTGVNLSETRFFEATRWPPDLRGQTVLEVGSGSGRFTIHAAATGSFVVSMDYSYAVEANYQSNGGRPNVLIVQGDVYEMPFPSGLFDKVFCFGMLQHTPDVRAAFMALPKMLKPGGELVVDVYKKTFSQTILQTKYWVRPFTRTMEPQKLYRYSRAWIDLVWPLASLIRRIPRVGRAINWRLLVADHSQRGIQGDVLKEWAYLDTFDMLSPRYDSPQTLATLREWFQAANMTDIQVNYGHNGIEGRGRKPLCAE